MDKKRATIVCKSGTIYNRVVLSTFNGGIFGQGGNSRHSTFIAFYPSSTKDVRLLPLYDVEYIDIHTEDT